MEPISKTTSTVDMEEFQYDNTIVRNFAIASIVFGIVGMLVGVLIAFQLAFPARNLDIPYTTLGRLRPLHTNAVIFAFVGNGFFMGLYYSAPRVLRTPMYSKLLSNINFWGWQLIIVAAAITLPLGLTTGKEYAELEWPIDIAVAVVWVAALLNLVMTMINRRVQHIYAAVWFYLAFVCHSGDVGLPRMATSNSMFAGLSSITRMSARGDGSGAALACIGSVPSHGIGAGA